jgi:hypothetical protein
VTTAEQCSVAGCGKAKAASLEGAALCREHFISTCYARLDHYDELRRGAGLKATDSESARRFINECSRNADEMEHDARDLDNLERAKLVHIILTASELGRHLRRSPRKAAAIAVRLSSDKLGGSWEEDTETVLLSQYGASVRCKHPAKPGETLEVVRSDTGEKAQARVAWQRPAGIDEVRIGVEFLACDNFWGLDWGAVEDAR